MEEFEEGVWESDEEYRDRMEREHCSLSDAYPDPWADDYAEIIAEG